MDSIAYGVVDVLNIASQSILYSYIGCMGGIDPLVPEFYSLVAKPKFKTYHIVDGLFM